MEKLKAEVEQYIGEVRDALNSDITALQDHVMARIAQAEREKPKQNGIVIDHKTFSEIINTLMVCGSQGVITNDLAFKLIEMGKVQTGVVAEPASEPVKAQRKPNCNGKCLECDEPHAKQIQESIAKDPIFQLLTMVREAAAHKR